MFWWRRFLEKNTSATSGTGAHDGDRREARQQWFCLLWALLLPPFIGVVDLLGAATHLRFLLFPPLVAIGYTLFVDPYGKHTSLRDSVLGPVVGALVGVMAITWLPVGPVRVMLVTATGILALRLLRIGLSPALAVALLTLLVGAGGALHYGIVARSHRVVRACGGASSTHGCSDQHIRLLLALMHKAGVSERVPRQRCPCEGKLFSADAESRSRQTEDPHEVPGQARHKGMGER